jgi:eukaryotic-like serine/threonine-protein kinase
VAGPRPWQREPLDADAAVAFAIERGELNRRRLAVLAPLMAVVHVLHVWHFHVPAGERTQLAPDVLRWRDGLVLAHAVMIPIAVAVAMIARWSRSTRIARLLGPIAVMLYLAHAAIVTGIDQIMVANMTVYVAYSFSGVLIFALTPLEGLIAYAIGAGLLITALTGPWSSEAERGTNLPTLTTLTVVCIALAWIMDAARRRELVQRRTIARQQIELAELNAGLERRVHAQVDEIVARAAEVDRLNAELREQVRARSTELSLALQRLADQLQKSRALAAGAVIAGRFEVEGPIGEGGMGAVYAGLDRTTGARVAIKVMQASSSVQLDALRRFLREADAAAAVAHPAVVRVLHVDVSDDGLLFQVQELVEGDTLTRRGGAAWPAADVARLGAVLCDALAAAHARGVIHRDVKPDNVMMTNTAPGLKLVDFGIAKLRDVVAIGGATVESVVLGTPAFMAPEQVASDGDVSDRADVYAVGVILYLRLAGRLPIDASTPQVVMAKKLTDDPDPLAPLAPDAPAALVAAIEACLARAPAARPSAAALAITLAAIADQLGAPPLEQLPGNRSISKVTLDERSPRGKRA